MTSIGKEKNTLTFKVLLYLFSQDYGFNPPCGSYQVPVFLKLKLRSLRLYLLAQLVHI